MRISKALSALGAFFVLALVIAGCGSGVPGDAVANVDGNPITVQAFNHWMYVAAKGNASQSAGAPVIVPNDPPRFKSCLHQVRVQIPTLAKTPDKQIRSDCAQLFTSLSTQVMNFLIKAYWYQAEAHKLGVQETDAQLNKAFLAAKKQSFPTATAFATFLSQTGQTVQDARYRVRVNEIYKRLLARDAAKITPAAIQAYYTSHQSQFGTPATRNIRIVRANSQSAVVAAKAALASGQSWAKVAKQYSVDTSTKNSGGLLTGVTNGQEEKALNTAAFSAPLNKVVGPIHGSFGWYIVEVVKITPGTTQSLTKATPLIRQLLTSQNQQTAQTAVDKRAKADFGPKTTCRSAYAMADCHGYTAPKTTTTPATSTPTTTPTATSTTSGGSGSGTTGTITATTSTSSGTKKKK